MNRLEIFTGRAFVDGRPVALTPRELDLLTTLGLERRGLSRARLEDTLWPDASSRGALAVCVHRVRAALGAASIATTPGGYALGEIAVDLWELERLALELRFVGPLGTELAARTLAAHAYLSARSGAERLRVDELASAVERRAEALVRAFAERLAVDAMRSGRLDQALTLADQMLGADACDEDAWEIAIRAHLARSHRGAAIRRYRDYERVLREQLGLAPSAHLQRLLGDAATAAAT